jgi:2-alkyl-3-oxoalkanoate reductase
MSTIAIIGAAGFVGSRLIETALLQGEAEIRAVVRSKRSLARLCRYGLGDRLVIADAEAQGELEAALKGCGTVVNLISSDPDGIVRSTRSLHAACREAGVRRLVHLSSAVVYGTVESPEIHDDSPLPADHWMPYARAKIAAEQLLLQAAGEPGPEVTILRPGIVWGPRSRWSLGAALALKQNRAFLVGDGSGICDSIYIDNLVACILECCNAASPVTGAFNIADEEQVTWSDFYASLAGHLGYDMRRIRSVDGERFRPTLQTMLLDLKETPIYHRLKKRLTLEQRARIKQTLASLIPRRQGKAPAPDGDPGEPKLLVARDMWHLQKTRHKLPTAKFAKRFNFSAPVSFSEGTRMTVNWLNFLGI